MTIFLDNAATSFPKPETVYRAVDAILREIGVSPGRGGYRRAITASRLLFEAREVLAGFLGAPDPSRLVFTHSATESINMAVAGLLQPGQHVVASAAEHNSLLRPLRLAEKRGVSVSWVTGDRSGVLQVETIEKAIRAETALVAISHCSNVTGTIQPIAAIGSITRSCGVPLLVDAAQSAGSMDLNVTAMQIDLLALPGHKGLLGPQGTGALYVGEGIDLDPLLVGGTGTHSSLMDQPEELPERLESGTLNLPGIAGLKAGVEYILETGLSTIRSKEILLVEMILDGMRAIPAITQYGLQDAAMRGAPVSFTMEGYEPSEIGFILDQKYDISVRTGLHCAPALHQAIGTYPSGTVRVSPGWFTTETDIESLLHALHAIATGASRGRQ
jgi:cysteine desulfurase family protein